MVREMYWPKVSVKKQLELEVIKTNIKNKSIRRSAADLHNLDENPRLQPNKGLGYHDKPWRKAMSKGPSDLVSINSPNIYSDNIR